jgi:YggT family protein
MALVLATAISYFFSILSWIVIIDVIISYFMNPYHPFRAFLDRLVEPLITPIRKVVPPIMGIDFSPMVLIILLRVVESLLVSIVRAM